MLDPFLQLAKLALKLAQLFEIFLSGHLVFPGFL
jgi:hypothetical protein